ncbi:MAG: HNH endonuclease [Mesorhizobium sp.]|nr:MAG: HNH endonuclease [Mesorhizobium sp.]
MTKGPTQDFIKSILDYDPETGIFTWRARGDEEEKPLTWQQRIWNRRYAGTRAGYSTDGYERISIGNRKYFSARLAWLYVYGSFPDGLIDHISHDHTDNRIVNLRVVDDAGNAKNKKLDPRNKSGVSGVWYDAKKSKWFVSIGHEQRTLRVGRFKSFEAAVEARKLAEVRLGYHPNHGAPDGTL